MASKNEVVDEQDLFNNVYLVAFAALEVYQQFDSALPFRDNSSVHQIPRDGLSSLLVLRLKLLNSLDQFICILAVCLLPVLLQLKGLLKFLHHEWLQYRLLGNGIVIDSGILDTLRCKTFILL